MTTVQRIVKYFALLLAAVIVVSVACAAINGLSFIAGLFDDKETDIGEIREYMVEGEIRSLDIDIDAARIDIILGDELIVRSNIDDITVKNERGTLAVKYKNRFNIYAGEAVVEITVPAELVFGEVSVSTGANKLYADIINANKVDIDFGAGSAEIDRLVAKKECDIDTGAGKVVIGDCDISDLDLDIGTGKFELAGALMGDCVIDMGVGSVDIILVGTPDDYCFDIGKGIGNITIDGNEMRDGETLGTGDCHIQISGGVGSVTVGFEN